MPGHEWTRRGVIAAAAAATVAPRRIVAAAQQTWSNAVLVMPDGTTQEGGIRIRAGIIEAVGPDVTGGVDLNGAWVVPGFTDAGCRLGLLEVGLERSTHDLGAGENQALDARATDGYNPRSELIPVARVNGITSVVLNPESQGMIPGQAALMRTVGTRLSDAIIDAPIGLCMNLGRAASGNDGPTSRIGVMRAWRSFFEEHPKPEPSKKRKRSAAKKDADESSGSSPNAEAVARQLRTGELLALIRANRADDIERALELVSEHDLRAVLVGCVEGHLVADSIAAAELPVFLGPIDAQPSSFQHPHARYENAALLHDAGVKLAFRSGDAHGVRKLPTLAGLAVAHGLPWSAAIQALTIHPMDVLGQPTLGRLSVGAEATFFVADGDPLQPRTDVRAVYVRGQAASMETRQTRLYEEFKELW
ncbi:MAG: amidohydrolase family protein [Myxococcota bacterium]|nr:amidohydrolase family protein [Myxococcota bacterium]